MDRIELVFWTCRTCENADKCTACGHADGIIVSDDIGDNVYMMCHDAVDRMLGTGHIARCRDDGALHNRYATMWDTDRTFSAEYAENECYHCTECGRWFERYGYMRNSSLCEECAQGLDVIRDYHEHKGCFVKHGDRNDKLTVGMELEIEHEYGLDDSEHNDVARGLIDLWGDAAVYEWDSSLDDGFEIILQPHTMPAFDALPLEKAINYLLDNDYCYDKPTAGLHVHVSVEHFGNTEEEQARGIRRLCTFYVTHGVQLEELAGRESCDYARFTALTSDTASDLDFIEWKVYDTTRYSVINTQGLRRTAGNKTVEFRLASGELDARKIRRWVKLCVALAKASSITESYSWTEWLEKGGYTCA